MSDTHELLGRTVNPIDDIRLRFEDFYTRGDYYDPSNGDWWSDDYWRIIDLTTQNTPLNPQEAGKLERSILRFNERAPIVGSWLGSTSLLDAYNGVVEQINAINASNPAMGTIPEMLPAPETEQITHESLFAQLIDSMRE